MLDNNGGYFCPAPGQCAVQAVRPPDSADASWMVSVADPYATNLVLSGITFYGGWSPGRGAYAAKPQADPWLDKQGGVNITHAFAGVRDEAFIANSTIKAQLPLDHIENLVVAGFGGDCLRVQGAGQNTYHNIRGSTCGGHGLSINSYDNKFTDIDFGATGRSCLFMDDQGATNYVQGKAWYCGFRLQPGDDVGLKNISSGNVFDVTVQDTYGDAILDAGRLSIITASISWQGVLSPMDAGPISAYVCLACDHNIVTLNAAVFETNQKFPNVTRLYRDLLKDGRGGTANTVTIVEKGWPQDYGGWQAAWLEGPIDASNRITLNGVDRAHGNQPDSSGQLAYAIPMNGSATGLVAFGPGSGSPGKVALLCQAPQAAACTLQGYRNDAGQSAYSSALTWDRDGHPGMPNLPGPYRNDAAAARAGVPVGNLYLDRRSLLHVRRAPRPRRPTPKTPR